MKDFNKFVEEKMAELEEARKDNKKEVKELESRVGELFEDSSCAIVITDKGMAMVGHELDVKTALCMFIKNSTENNTLTKKDFEEVLELGSKDASRIVDGLKEMLEKIKSKLGE